ncbi:MAG TPA: hypothetical protein VGW36_07585, partial [Pyrinomonadaceae bacterium]|nr:hypothetical protein [Pyrinomonadaceae bacterium]
GAEKQALILARRNVDGTLSFRFQPISNLRQDADGRVHFELARWQSGFPLKIFEDKQLALAADERESWLSQWHTDAEWLRVLYKTKYSNGLIGFYEAVARHELASLSPDQPGLSPEERLNRRFMKRQRELVDTDLVLVANDHWNFDVRGFNPGGNHGSFFRVSTHSTFMLAGGDQTGIPRAAVVEEPYDSLSFVPTVLALTGNLRDDNTPVPNLWAKGFRRFPGRPVHEVLTKSETRLAPVTKATATP